MENMDKKDDIISHDQKILFMRVLVFGVTPAISILGIVGNIFSIIILLEHGLRKCSNILLISLAVADLTYLVAVNNMPKVLYDIVGIEKGYGYSQEVSWTLFVLNSVFIISDYTSVSTSLTMPMLITFERLIAVYSPLKFNCIITPFRTWCAVAVVAIYWFTYYVYLSSWQTLTYNYDSNYNTSVGRMGRSTFYHNSQSAVEILEEVMNYMCMKVPPVVTLIGCILISVKVRMASRQRQRMAQRNSRDSSTNRTTKMLLAVCVIYIFACGILSLPIYFPQYVQYDMFSELPNHMSSVLYQVISISMCFNSSANFVIYVVLNKNFRETYKSLFTYCQKP